MYGVLPTLRVRAVAEALRRASVERGVRLVLLTYPEALREGGGYLGGLAMLGAEVRLFRPGSSPPEPELVVDGRYLLKGRDLAYPPPPGASPEPVRLYAPEAAAARAAALARLAARGVRLEDPVQVFLQRIKAKEAER